MAKVAGQERSGSWSKVLRGLCTKFLQCIAALTCPTSAMLRRASAPFGLHTRTMTWCGLHNRLSSFIRNRVCVCVGGWVPLREDRTSAIATSRVALPNGSACSCEQRGARQHAVGRTKGEVRRTERPPQPSALPLERLARNPPSEQTTPPWNQHAHTAPLLSSPAQEGIHDRRGAAPFQAGEA